MSAAFAVMVTKEELKTLREACLALNLHWISKGEAIKRFNGPNADAHRADYEARAARAAALYARLATETTVP